MKNLILLFFVALMGLTVNVNAQNHGTMGVGDTVTVSSAIDTGYLYAGALLLADARDLSRYDDLSMNFRLDSLSGATAGTIYVEYTFSDDPTEIGAEWFRAPAGNSTFTYMNGTTATTASSTTATSFTVNGTRCELSWSDPNFTGTYARMRYLTGTSNTSQSNRIRGWWAAR